MEKRRALKREGKKSKVVAVVVAHPDDETLWAGGTILCHPEWHLFIACLCRASDRERAGKFHRVLKVLKAEGIMGDLDDGPEQKDLDEKEVEQNILALLPKEHFDLIISHDPAGEYTRHRRHEETGKAVIKLWNSGRISANELWTFAYQDGNKTYYPRPEENAAVYKILPERIWMRKYQVITQIYGFEINSWEARSVTKAEAFGKFTDPKEAEKLLNNRGSD
jgi:LmbE family N-acetylglucosaminyl deacetylase